MDNPSRWGVPVHVGIRVGMPRWSWRGGCRFSMPGQCRWAFAADKSDVDPTRQSHMRGVPLSPMGLWYIDRSPFCIINNSRYIVVALALLTALFAV